MGRYFKWKDDEELVVVRASIGAGRGCHCEWAFQETPFRLLETAVKEGLDKKVIVECGEEHSLKELYEIVKNDSHEMGE